MSFADRVLRVHGLSLALALAACSDDGVPASEHETGGTSVADEGVGTGAEVTTVSSASASTSGGSSGSASTSHDPTSAGEAGSSGGEGTGDSGPGTTSGGMPEPGSCETDRDCVLVDDCCTCAATDLDTPSPDCEQLECPATACELAGLSGQGVQCRFGTCEIVPASCNDDVVSCEVVPPQCPEGTQPETDGMGCWTFECVPTAACDVVPSCEVCTKGETCVETVGPNPSWWSCEPLPIECAGVPTCGCMPGVCNHPVYHKCVDTPNGIDCVCLDC